MQFAPIRDALFCPFLMDRELVIREKTAKIFIVDLSLVDTRSVIYPWSILFYFSFFGSWPNLIKHTYWAQYELILCFLIHAISIAAVLCLLLQKCILRMLEFVLLMKCGCNIHMLSWIYNMNFGVQYFSVFWMSFKYCNTVLEA